ncbi:MAG: hypothetical protein U0W24_23370 [Bacteroidales bacterium]
MTGLQSNNFSDEIRNYNYPNRVCKDYRGNVILKDKLCASNISVAEKKAANPNKPFIHKLFSMRNGTINENLLYHKNQPVTSGFINSCCGYPVSGLIILIDSRYDSTEFFTNHPGLQKITRFFIRYNATIDSKKSNQDGITEILSKSLSQAVCKSYELVENNQAILVADVDTGFDFFSHFEE